MNDRIFKCNLNFKPNDMKIEKSVNRTLRNAHFLLQLEFPYSLALSTYRYNYDKQELVIKSDSHHEVLKKLYLLDAQIRHVDDVIDEELRPINNQIEIDKEIQKFEKDYPIAYDVAKLFKIESALINNQKLKQSDLIIATTEVRPADFFALSEILKKEFPSKLNKKDFAIAEEFYKEYHRYRDIIDDMISIDEDIVKNNYNIVIQSKSNGLSADFIQDLAIGKLTKLKQLLSEFSNDVMKKNYCDLIEFWEKEHDLMLKPLLFGYYENINTFRETYFYIK
ncbi:MAG: hypothetical protein PHQ98_04490 [Candidatus ainarchaeum sp.]|nr:hypothetical protein [Candidatus ainarchaeum sp.]